jgi:ATP-binding cassette subfamily B protein
VAPTAARKLEAPHSGGASRRPGAAVRLGGRLRRLFVPEVTDLDVVGEAPPVPLGTLFRRFWPDARPHRRWLVVVVAIAAVVPVVEAAQVWLFKLVVDDALVPGELGALAGIAVAYVGLALAAGVLGFAEDYLSALIGERFLLSLRRRFYGHLLRQSPDVLDRRKLGDLLSRLTADIQTIESFVLGSAAEAVSIALRILLFGAALFYLSWQLALVSLVVAPLSLLAAKRFGRLIKHASREKRRLAGSLTAVAEEGLANAALVQSYGRHDTELARFARQSEGILTAELAATRLRALFAPLVELIELAGVLLVLAWGTWALSQGSLTLGGLLAFLAYLGLLYRPVRDLGQLGTSAFAASAAAERVLELLDQPPLVAERPGASAVGRARGELELTGVTFRYPGASEPTLADVSLVVRPGELVVLTGPSGSGKSTLAKLLVRLFDPSEGSIRIDGHDLRDLPLDDVRRNVGVLLQEALVFDASVRENIAYGRPGADDAAIVAAARAAGAHAFVEALPAGYATSIGQKGRRLSGGQRQRIALARLLLRDPAVVVLDEPFTGLDRATAAGVREALQRVVAGRTAIVITHDPAALPDATATVVLEHGRIVARRDSAGVEAVA